MKDYSKYTNEIRIRALGKQLHDDLNNISDNVGVPLSNLVKPKLIELRDSYPEYMRQPKKED